MVNKQIRNPGEIARFDARGQISGDVPSFAVYQGQAAEVLANLGAGLSKQLGDLADKAKVREDGLAGLAYGQRNGAAYLQARAVGEQAAGAAGTGPWMEQAKALLRKEEGFRETPYWDVTAHRVGYGSDTTVTADGKVVRVSKGMKITREDAERDLDHRLMNVEGAKVRQQLGPAWDKLSESGKAALASVGYNYGSLPSAIVKAARTGDTAAIAAAVGGLAANKSRRGREAAMILGGGPVVASKSDDAAIITGSVKPAAGGEVATPLSTEPLALRRDGTLGGEAFDRAAASAYAWRVQEGLSRDLFAAHEQFQDDPAGFQAAAAKVRDTYLQDDTFQDPEMREMFDKGFSERSEAYARSVATNHEKNLRNEELAAYAGGIASQQIDLERQAQVLGASPDGDRIVGARVASMQRSVDAAVSSGTITPLQGQAEKERIAETGARGRIQGVYEALPTPERKQQFAISLLDDWQKGDGPLSALPYDTVKGISDTLRRDAQERITQFRTQNKVEAANVEVLLDDDTASIETTGKGLDTEASGLTPDRVLSLLGEEKFDKWKRDRDAAGRLYDATSGLEAQSPADIKTHIDLLKPKAGSAGFAEQEKIYEAAKKKADDLLKERQTDPLGQAERAKIVTLEPIDTSSPEATSESLGARRKQADLVAKLYGVDTPLFRKQEVDVMKTGLTSIDPARHGEIMMQLDFMSGVSGMPAVKTMFGEDATARLQDWQARIRYATLDEAKQWLKDRNDPQWQERVKPLVSKGETEARKIEFADVVAGLDENSFYDANAPIDAETKRMMMNDFVALTGERFAVTSDIGSAKEQAFQRMQKVWGVSSVFGERGGRVMLYPPEEFYPPIGGSSDWMKTELATVATGRGVPPENLTLITDKKTKAAIERGELPGYMISVVDPATGFDEIMTDDQGRPLRHFFDIQTAKSVALAAAEDARRRSAAPFATLGMTPEAANEALRTRNDPWIVLGDGTSIGPYYPFGATKKDEQDRRRRVKEIQSKGRGTPSALQAVEDYERENGPGNGAM